MAHVSGHPAHGSVAAKEETSSLLPLYSAAALRKNCEVAGCGQPKSWSRRSAQRGAHRKAEGRVAGAGGSEEKGRRSLYGAQWRLLKVSETPKGSPQCPGATPSPLEDQGTMPKFGGNWGQCPVVFLDAGAVLPTSWPSSSVLSLFGAHKLFQKSELPLGHSRKLEEANINVMRRTGEVTSGNNAQISGIPSQILVWFAIL